MIFISLKGYALGISVNKIAIQSTDSEWKPTFIDSETVASKTIMKVSTGRPVRRISSICAAGIGVNLVIAVGGGK